MLAAFMAVLLPSRLGMERAGTFTGSANLASMNSYPLRSSCMATWEHQPRIS